MRSLKSIFRRSLERFGYQIVKHPNCSSDLSTPPWMKLLRHYGVDLVLDVGANRGQYHDKLRAAGYTGHVVCFEPLTSVYRLLTQHLQQESSSTAVNVALGAKNEQATINVSQNTYSSSLLPILRHTVEAAPRSAYVSTEEVTVCMLDSVFNTYYSPGQTVFLKIDAQGYEHQILSGAQQSLKHIEGLQLELSLVPLYEGQRLFFDMIKTAADLGFVLMSLEPDFRDPVTGQLLQADGIFFRPRA